MRILQVSNLVSHHQLPLARAFVKVLGGKNFRFAATQPPDAERLRLGWNDDITESWILRTGVSHEDRSEFEQWWAQADIILCGERLFSKMEERLAHHKICLYSSERWWKPRLGRTRLLHPAFLKMALKFRQLAQSPSFHYLPKGPFATSDIKDLVQMNGRMWQWGYFTEPPSPSYSSLSTEEPIRILWVGRMLKWKKVDTILKALSHFRKAGGVFNLTLVGEGPEKNALENLAKRILPDESVKFFPPIPAAKVPEIMRRHHVYILPSSAQEGWGAVINEAMACGCAVVASERAGAAASMINHKKNGLLFRPGDWVGLAQHLHYLANNEDFRKMLGDEAQRTVNELWKPQIAASRLISVSDALLNNRDPFLYASGPMAKAN